MPLDFVIKKSGKFDAEIFSEGSKVAEIKKKEENDGEGGPQQYLLAHSDGRKWLLSNSVHGEPRPFSFSVRKPDSGEVFVVRDQLFKHNGRFYMMANHPSGRHWSDHVKSPVRYIGRLDGFPYPELEQVDYHDRDLRDKIKRLRGTPVGQASGLGIEEKGHRVHVDSELEDAGLFIAAISYLIYASA
ncbi:MAG: hypothetical protein ABI347_01835 [Nitrososphaera sp.]